jgi:hypothetical protein
LDTINVEYYKIIKKTIIGIKFISKTVIKLT